MRAFKEVMLHGKNKMLRVFPREFHYKPNIFFALDVLTYFYSLFSIIGLSFQFLLYVLFHKVMMQENEILG